MTCRVLGMAWPRFARLPGPRIRSREFPRSGKKRQAGDNTQQKRRRARKPIAIFRSAITSLLFLLDVRRAWFLEQVGRSQLGNMSIFPRAAPADNPFRVSPFCA